MTKQRYAGAEEEHTTHGVFKLAESDYKAIKNSKSSQAALAKQYDVSQSTISRIRSGKIGKSR